MARIVRALLSGAAVLTAAGLYEPVWAVVVEDVDSTGTLPGSACRKIGTAGSLGITTDGAVFNDLASGGAFLTVECPVAAAAQGLITFEPSSIVYLDHSPSAITCTLRAEDAGSTAANSLTVTSVGDDNTYRTMSLVGLQGFAEGQMHLRCTIPPRDSTGNASFIVGYLVDDDPINAPFGKLGYHTFTGSNCRQVGTAGAVGFTTDGTIFNDLASGGAALSIDCPIMTTRAGSATAAKTKVWYLDSSPAALSCTLRAEDAATTAVSLFTQTTSGIDDNFYRNFTFSGATGVTTFDDGYAHLQCTLPARDSTGFPSHIVGYSLN